MRILICKIQLRRSGGSAAGKLFSLKVFRLTSFEISRQNRSKWKAFTTKLETILDTGRRLQHWGGMSKNGNSLDAKRVAYTVRPHH